jgi:hypothetical protein
LLYYVKTEAEAVEEVLWWLAEGVDISVLVRKTGHSEGTLTRWLNRMGEHSTRWHAVLFQDLSIVLIQMDELYAKVRGVEGARWLWLAIDPKSKALLALHLGLRRSEEAYILVHKPKKCLHSDCVPAFTTDGLGLFFRGGRSFRSLVPSPACPQGPLATRWASAPRSIGEAARTTPAYLYRHPDVVGQMQSLE